MWSSRAVLAVALLGCAPAAAEHAACPSYTGTHPLDYASLFEGPPADKVELMGGDDGWDLTPYKDKPARYFLVCRFSHTAATKLVALPAGVSGCKITVHAGATRIDCQ